MRGKRKGRVNIHFDILSSLDNQPGLADQMEIFQRRFRDAFFISPGWLSSFQQILCQGQQAEHIVGRDESGNLRGTIHLARVTTSFLKLFRLRAMCLLGTRSVVSPEHLELAIDPDYRQEWYGFFERHLRQTMNGSAFLVFDSVSNDAPNADGLMTYLRERGFYVVKEDQDVCPGLELPGSLEELMERYSPNMRKIVRRTLKRNAAELRLVDYSEIGSLEAAFDKARRLHMMSREQKGQASSFERQGYVAFHRELSRVIEPQGKLYLKFLMRGTEPVSFRYGFLSGDVYYDYQTGYDPIVAKQRPGFLIVALIIQDLISRGIKRFDFLRGDEGYKRHWAPLTRRTSSYYAFPPGFKSRVYHTLLRLYHGVK